MQRKSQSKAALAAWPPQVMIWLICIDGYKVDFLASSHSVMFDSIS